jgi:quinohemoprotein ethanol dehydrogenase
MNSCQPDSLKVVISLKVVLLSLLLLFSCRYENQYGVIDDRAISDEKSNVADLKVDWYIDLPNDVGLVSTPLVVNGILYFTGTMNVVRAVDAVSGEFIWDFDPEVGKHIGNDPQVGWAHNRGLSFYKGKVFAATWDGRLIALDAETGTEIWTAVTFNPDKPLFITGAPKAFKGKVLIGNGGTENGPSRGFVTAYDSETGKEAWKFYIVPGNPADGFENEAMEMAAGTWTGEWWKHGGGGNAWHGFTYDADLDVLYIGTGNGSPWNRKIRSPGGGDNLFLCSIVALNPDTGAYLWHYQTTPGEVWDYNSNMDIVLADLMTDDKIVKAILHAPKNGFFYVINRETGKLISAEPFVETTWASHIDLKTGKPVEIEGARYDNGPFDIAPNAWGAHSWQAMSYNPQTRLAYIPSMHQASRYSDEGVDIENWQAVDFSGGTGVGLLPAESQPKSYPASLQAWDPVKQELAWSIPQDNFWNAGTLTTGGNLVFQGRSDGEFLAYNAETGEIIWTFDAGLGISAPPITYKINGRQYISLLVGFGGGYARGGLEAHKLGWSYRMHTRRLITFSLDGNAEMPALPPRFYPRPIVDPNFEINEELALQGEQLYWSCFNCHGDNMFGGGMAPDLRASAVPMDKAAFTSIVRDGANIQMGMPSYPEITVEQLEALRHFIRKRAIETLPDYEALADNLPSEGNPDDAAKHN